MSTPLVSIIIPVFKVEPFIERCLLSVAHQSYQNIECILIDDCSPDQSMKMAESFISKHSDFQWKKVIHEKNLGLSLARNSGLDVAIGKYIYFLDSDDELKRDAIEKLVHLAEETQAEMVLGEMICVNKNDHWEKKLFPIKYFSNQINEKNKILEAFVDGQYPVMACDKLTRLDFIKKNNLYFIKDLFSQDELWSFHCALRLKKIAFLKETTYVYYFHSASIIHNRTKRNFDNWHTIAEYFDLDYRKEKKPLRKRLILRKINRFKFMTLGMNWKAQKNEDLWKESFNNYKKISSLKFKDYVGAFFSLDEKKKAFQLALPTTIAFWLMVKRHYK